MNDHLRQALGRDVAELRRDLKAGTCRLLQLVGGLQRPGAGTAQHLSDIAAQAGGIQRTAALIADQIRNAGGRGD